MPVRFSLLIWFISAISTFEIDLNIQDKIQHGKQRYSELGKKANSYGECWKKAMLELHEGCKQLTEEVQSRLALSFSNCFLKHTGSKICPCSNDIPISTCLKNSTDRMFSTYTEFYTHTQSICHYLQHRQWQEEAANTVLILMENSAEVGKKLEKSAESQSKIINLQHATMYEQKRLISSGRTLNKELQKSRQNARSVYNDFKSTADEQRLLLFEVFDRLRNLQNFVLGEFSGVYTVAYYVFALVIIYILTTTPRTADARIWLILTLSLNAVAEKVCSAYSIEYGLNMNVLETNELVHSRIWMLRKVTCFICIIILVVFYYQYKDYSQINYELLQQILQQNKELQMFIKGVDLSENSQKRGVNSAKASQVLCENNTQTSISLNTYEFGSSASVSSAKTKSPVPADSDKLSTKLKSPLNLKENDSSVANSATEIKDKKVAVKKKSSSIRSPLKRQDSPMKFENISPNINSPGSGRYNLRRSSRLNSPAAPLPV